ncbi:HNH endonuclease [Caballeronia cordobensis]|uniref:HNH endonuclease n=1 Tax=Caballeronia cordobensis TaxID=1353886 RepID=UPI00045EFACD|nr:Gp70 protein [Burkholderia sp. RPE67]
MPARPKRPCKHRGCGALVSGNDNYCEKHQGDEVKWKPDAVRGNRHARGYGNAWVKRRERILLRDCGLCQPCKRAGRVTIASEVDHVVPKAQGGSDDDSNCQSICNACHKAKTAREPKAR